MLNVEFTKVDRILAKVHRDLKGIDLNESDIIEYIGEALDFMKIPEIQEESVAFSEVKNHQTELPTGFHNIIQIARNNLWTSSNKKVVCPSNVLPKKDKEIEENPLGDFQHCYPHPANKDGYPIILDSNGLPLFEDDLSYKPFFSISFPYMRWTSSNAYLNSYTPVRLSNHSFFNSVVCKETEMESIYRNCDDEYTLVGGINKVLRFSFKEGSVAISYLKNMVDSETGYPLIPDHISCISAITYYIKWKISENYDWNGRQGYSTISKENNMQWLKYVRQFISEMKMPSSNDENQNLAEQSRYMIPNTNSYYNFYGNLGKAEKRPFNHPRNRGF